MFISKKRSKKNPNVYVQLVESYRQDGKMNQRVIKHIGTAPSEEHLEKIIKLANVIKEMFLQNISTKQIEIYHKQEINKINGTGNLIQNCVPVKRIAKGIQDIYGKIFDAMGLNQIIVSKTNYAEIIKNIVIGRIACLGSKRKTCEQLEKKFNKKYSLSALYRAMDKLTAETIELIQTQICNYNKNLLNNEIKVLFYDATTIYFESFNDDELRRLGYSKDLKFSQPQIILTMLVTSPGLPLGYQVFPGNTYEGNTLLTAMSYWKKLYPQQKITLVADSGMLNEINLSTLEQDGFDYIVCARLKSFSKNLKEQIIDNKYQGAGDYYYNLDVGSRRLIISYRENRAIKDRYDRNKAINNLKTKLKTSRSPATLISNYGYKKYITIDAGSEITLNEDKIIEAEKWDGLHGLITNIKDLNAEDVYGYYRGLWQIEDAFRINKTDLEIRPIFHWTPDRIKAHMAISYIAYCCYKTVEFKVNQELNEKISHRMIKELLDEIETIIYEDQNTSEQFMMPTPASEKAKAIYKIFNQELIYRPCRYIA
jgi:transposase